MTPARLPGGALDVQVQPLKTSGTNYNFSIDYKVTPELLVYAATRKGYVPGGLNNSRAAGAPGFKLQYDPESIEDVEAGFKWDSNLAGMKGRLNMQAIEAAYSNIQKPVEPVANDVYFACITNVLKPNGSAPEEERVWKPVGNPRPASH